MLDVDGLVEKETSWTSFQNSDVWIYFLSNLSELVLLPQPIADSISSNDNAPTGGLTRYVIDVQSGRKILLMIVLMEEYLELEEFERHCQISNAIYREIYDFENSLGRYSFSHCENQ